MASLSPRHPLLRKVLPVLAVAVVLGCFAVAAITQGSKLSDFHWRFEPRWLALAVLAFVAFQGIQQEGWRITLGFLGERLDPPRARAIWNVSLLGRYVPTSAMMAVGRISIAERYGVSKRVCLVSVLYEVALALTAAACLAAYWFIRLPGLAGHPARFLIVAVPLAAVAALHPRVFHTLANAGLRRLGRDVLPREIPFGRVLVVLALYLVTFLVAGVGTYAFAHAIHPVAARFIPLVLVSFSVGFIASVAGFLLPAGLGARETALASALAPALPLAVGLAVAVGVRLIQMAIEVLYAVVTPALARRAAAA